MNGAIATALFHIAFTLVSLIPLPAPPGCGEPEARQFDFWLGQWSVLNRNRAADSGSWHDTGRATDLVHSVAEGCAIVEHWRGDAYGQFVIGFSVRAWDARARVWNLVLLWPASGDLSFARLEGAFRHGRGEFFGRSITAAGDSVLTRFTFSDVRPDALRWENGSSSDGGRSWSSNWIMEFTRRDPATDAAPLNAPTTGTGRCPEAEHRALDFLTGEWKGIEHDDVSGEDHQLRTRVLPILDGCASIEIGVAGDRHVFAVRAWERRTMRWVEYRIDDHSRTLTRLEAPAGDDPFTFTQVGPTDAPATRTLIARQSDGDITRTTQRRAGDGSWRTTGTSRLSSVLRGDR